MNTFPFYFRSVAQTGHFVTLKMFFVFCTFAAKFKDNRMSNNQYNQEVNQTISLSQEILHRQDPAQAEHLSRFFKTGKGEYGEGDKFLGIKVPVVREIVKKCWQSVSFYELEACVTSEYHEMRLAGLLTLVQFFKAAKGDRGLQQLNVSFYLSHLQFVNNWDLVDLTCYEILGVWLLDKDRKMLYDMVENGTTIWEQRIGIVTMMQFLRHGELDDTYALAELFLKKPAPLHDLLQKAAGWLLREAGKRDEQRLREWLEPRRKTMPRTMLRYAIEKFPEEERKRMMER